LAVVAAAAVARETEGLEMHMKTKKTKSYMRDLKERI
jgi:hypothetical protein